MEDLDPKMLQDIVYTQGPAGRKAVNFVFDHEALAILARYAPSHKSRGYFLSRLLHEHEARLEAKKEERARLLKVSLTRCRRHKKRTVGCRSWV